MVFSAAMPRRLKVLISAYACEPHKGSEPEVGWQWSLQMARFHDVTVLTRANNRPTIEQELERLRPEAKSALPAFVYHDESPFLLELKRSFHAIKLYYLLWQRSAREVVERLHQAHHFDLFHHVTFAGFRYPAAIWGHGAPSVWGPIGGIESIPVPLLPWFHPKSLLAEITRDAHNLLQATPYYILPKRAAATTVILASTPEMQRAFARLGFAAQIMPTIGLDTRTLPCRPRLPHGGPLRLLFVGNIITLKGIDLALCALKESRTDAAFTLIGDGNYLPAARRLVKKLGLEEQVHFRGRLPRNEVLELYSEYDVFLFPSLHDTGGYAVIEAMFNQLPVICLDCGGPGVAVRENCGCKVPAGLRGQLIANLADAIRHYHQDRDRVREEGRAAREVVLREYDWEKKGEQMNEVYQKAMDKKTEPNAGQKGYSGLSGVERALHRMFSFRGAVIGMVGLLLIGALGFLSLSHLKHQADQIVNDTLPGLSYGGAANSSLDEAFNRTLLLLIADDPNQRAKLRKEVEEFNQQTTQWLDAYSNQVFEAEDLATFQALSQARQEYVKLRTQVIELASNGQQSEALRTCNESLLPAYERYKDLGDKLLEYNIRQGQSRGKTIMAVCTLTQVVVAGIGIIIFILGFLVGLFK